MKQEENKAKQWWAKVRKKSRFVVLNDETFEEKRSFTLSPVNMFVYFSFTALVIGFISFLLFSYTPLNRMIPGVVSDASEEEMRRQGIENLSKLDQISHELQVKQQYTDNILAVLNEDSLQIYDTDPDAYKDSTIDYGNIQFDTSKEDSLLRLQVEAEERYRVGSGYDMPSSARDEDMKGVFFFTPLEGEVTNSFGSTRGHFGVDIIAPENEAVKSTLNGTVIFTGWTVDNGHVIQVQHPHNLISVYKHNSELLHEMGDRVAAGEAIAIVGNTGELSTGAHLHFELWYNGKPINPQEFIAF